MQLDSGSENGPQHQDEDLEFSNLGRRRNIMGLLVIVLISIAAAALLACAGLGVFHI